MRLAESHLRSYQHSGPYGQQRAPFAKQVDGADGPNTEAGATQVPFGRWRQGLGRDAAICGNGLQSLLSHVWHRSNISKQIKTTLRRGA